MVLVTGATGLIGSHLLILLAERGEKVRAIFRDEKRIGRTKAVFTAYGKTRLFDSIEWLKADITDIPSLEGAFDGIQHVYHCAALISFDPNDEEKLRKFNIEGTSNIVNMSLAKRVCKICHVSSTAALGNLKDHETIITEESEWNPEKPHSDYAISKYGAEMEIWRGRQEGLDAVIINPGIVLGPGFWDSGSGQVFSMIKKGVSYYTLGTTGFVGVKDVVMLMEKLMKSGISGERFIAVSDNLSFQQIFYAVADALKVKRPGTYARPWMTSLGWKADWFMGNIFGFKRKLTRYDASGLHTTVEFSNLKAKEALGFDFTSVLDEIPKIVALEQNLNAPSARQD